MLAIFSVDFISVVGSVTSSMTLCVLCGTALATLAQRPLLNWYRFRLLVMPDSITFCTFNGNIRAMIRALLRPKLYV
jgi:hypothetical protein